MYWIPLYGMSRYRNIDTSEIYNVSLPYLTSFVPPLHRAYIHIPTKYLHNAASSVNARVNPDKYEITASYQIYKLLGLYISRRLKVMAHTYTHIYFNEIRARRFKTRLALCTGKGKTHFAYMYESARVCSYVKKVVKTCATRDEVIRE